MCMTQTNIMIERPMNCLSVTTRPFDVTMQVYHDDESQLHEHGFGCRTNDHAPARCEYSEARSSWYVIDVLHDLLFCGLLFHH